ncbi:hypothetical protein [Chishuiella sp.]|uniref:hypothetical protein n=1 Tax=Chishuiella sp. TaxID=1969467 RepID=UPI0028AA901F|nr:hypothetical protein [Chishuiella sp.]
MKKVLIVIFASLIANISFAQEVVQKNDTNKGIVCSTDISKLKANDSLYILNNVNVSKEVFTKINPSDILTINVDKNIVIVDGIKYSGKVVVTTKEV